MFWKVDYCVQFDNMRNMLYTLGKKDVRKLTLQMLRDRKKSPPTPGEEVLLDLFISFSDDEDLQEADALEFCTAGNFVMESCK